MARQVRCINKIDRDSPYDRITHIGGTGWKLISGEAIRRIENGIESFYVENPVGDRVSVVVATSAGGTKYLKTKADGDRPNNLLSLPECT